MIDNLLQGAKFLYDNKKYEQAALTLGYAAPFINDKKVLYDIYGNMRMCYFLANNIPTAYQILELQEQLPVKHSWEIARDKSNFLRYLNRHQEAYEIAKTIADERTRYLALSWFEHKLGNTKIAFDLTERARIDSYWWKEEPKYKYKMWQGQPVKNLVIRAESGFGDQIIFARWISLLRKLCDNLYYDGPALESVFCRNFNIFSVKHITNYDDLYVVAIMSLPYFLQIDAPEDNIYLNADSNIVEFYEKKYPKTQELRIGICVQGEKTHVETNLRTLPLTELVDALSPLGEIVNLQKELSEKDHRIRYIPFESWEDTFALIKTCDVIVTCDTSISHAAASQGKETIVLMHAAAYFTWNHNQDCSKSLWYKNAWCIHQDRPCKWEEPIIKCTNLIRKYKSEFSF